MLAHGSLSRVEARAAVRPAALASEHDILRSWRGPCSPHLRQGALLRAGSEREAGDAARGVTTAQRVGGRESKSAVRLARPLPWMAAPRRRRARNVPHAPASRARGATSGHNADGRRPSCHQWEQPLAAFGLVGGGCDCRCWRVSRRGQLWNDHHKNCPRRNRT